MAAFQDLPLELVASICSMLMLEALATKRSPRRKRLAAVQARLALSRFSQTCSRYRATAQSFLFRCYGEMLFRSRTQRLFLRSLLDRPELATSVRYMNLTQTYTANTKAAREESTELLRKAQRVLRGGPADEIVRLLDEWHRQTTDDDDELENVLAPISLATLPHLKATELAQTIDTSFFSLLLDESGLLALLPGCKELEALSIVPYRPFYPSWELKTQTTEFLTLPALRKATLSEFYCFGGVELAPQSSNINDLTLDRATIIIDDLEQILNACRSLRRFSLSWEPRTARSIVGHARISPQEVVSALRAHRSTLRYFALDLSSRHYFLRHSSECAPDSSERKSVTSLKEFEVLENLFIDQGSILRGESWDAPDREIGVTSWTLVQLLPKQINTLKLIGPNSFYDALEQLPIQKKTQFPSLSLVTMEARCRRQVECLKTLHPFFQRENVALDIRFKDKVDESRSVDIRFEDEVDDSRSVDIRWDADPVFDLMTVGDLLESNSTYMRSSI